MSVALVIQHATGVLPIIVSSVACLVLTHFSTLAYPINGMILEGRNKKNKEFLFSLLFFP